jgi:signal transduction histidine kinase/CheY-like chemotaxis protein
MTGAEAVSSRAAGRGGKDQAIAWTGEFVEPHWERRFGAYSAARSLDGARAAIIVTTGTCLSFAPLDMLSLPWDQMILFLLDRAVITVLGVIALFLTLRGGVRRIVTVTYAQQYLFFTLNALIFDHPVLSRHGGILLPLIPIALLISLPGSFRMAAILCGYAAGVSLLFWGVLRPEPEAPLDLLVVILMTAIAYAMGAAVRIRFSRMRREEYLYVEEERRTNQSLLEAKEAAEAGVRAKDTFLAVMSHEIRTPMHGVLGMVRLVLDGTDLEAEDRRRLTLARQSAEGLLTILDDILEVAKLEAGRVDFERRPFSPARTLRSVTDLLELRAREKGIGLTVDAPSDLPPWVSGDSARLRQILFNLVGNAIKFTERGGVTVEVRAAPPDGGLTRLTFRVIDTGIGISKEQLGRLFQPFAQGDASINARFGGTGLGLVICKTLVEAMGGAIAVSSEPGRGSRFQVSLTFALADEPARAPVVRGVDRPLRVLVADDNPVNAEVADAQLRKMGCDVVAVSDGAAALDRAREGGFDLILMDVRMPDVDGLEATRRIRALGGAVGAVPILGLTANSLPGDVARCLEAGMNGHLAKPMTGDQLRDAVADVLGEASRGPSRDARPATFDVLLAGETAVGLAGVVRALGHRAFPANGPEAAQAMLRARPFDLVIQATGEAAVPRVSTGRAAERGEEGVPMALSDARNPDRLAAVIGGLVEGAGPGRLEDDLSPEALARVRERFMEVLRDHATTLEDVDLTPGRLERVAHGLKGSAGAMGRVELSLLAAEIEAFTRAGTPSREALDDARLRLYTHVRRALDIPIPSSSR